MQPPRRFDIEECRAFFTLFARFEYAMKAAGIRQARKSGAVEADWNQLADDVASDLMAMSEKNIKEARAYLLQQPPNRQDLEGDKLVWSAAPASRGSDAKDLFVYICRVRSNLFHGGKFQGRYLADPEQSSQLIGSSTAILIAVLQLRPQLSEAFNG
ncbi:hypothetical protein [Nevskia ramosa]|uniref:hypothetical protein n=1 Tax=Nevskia ramosa TaxID=64002 RepID=UPI0012EBC0C0|nr:hypothetical protein [Nevskia ramosa]